MSSLKDSVLYIKLAEFVKQNKTLVGVVSFFPVLTAVRYVFYKLYRKYRKYPDGDIGLPYFGVFFRYARREGKYFHSLPKNFGEICFFNLGWRNICFINDIHLAKELFARDEFSDRMPSSFPPPVPFSSLNYKEHLPRRKIIHTALLNMLDVNYIDSMVAANVLNYIIPNIEMSIEKHELWVSRDIFFNISLNTVYGALFGELLDPNDIEFLQFQMEVKVFFSNLFRTWLIGFMFNGNGFLLNLFGKKGLQARANINVILGKWVNDYKNKKQQNKNSANDDKMAIIGNMLENYKKDEEEMLISDIGTMLLASADTTQSHLEQSITHLCLYPDIQEVVYNELNQVFGKNEEFSLKKVNQCHKFRAFVQEIIRLSQLIKMTLPRYLYKDVVVNLKRSCNIDKEYLIPKGTTIYANVAGIANQQPEFNIAHFLDDKGQFEQNTDTYLTFGCGKRECIGKNLAMKELYLILGMLIRKYKFQAPNNDIVSFEKTMCKYYVDVDAYKTPVEVVRR